MGRPGTVVLDRLFGLSFATGGAPGGALGTGAIGGVYQVGMLSFSHAGSQSPGRELTTTRVGVSPSFDVFVTRRLTVGGAFAFGYQWQSSKFEPAQGGPVSFSGYEGSLSPRIGYYVPFSESVAFWPRFSVSLAGHRRTTDLAPALAADTGVRWGAALDLDLAVPVTKHLQLLVGPRIEASTGSHSAFEQRDQRFQAQVHGSLPYAF